MFKVICSRYATRVNNDSLSAVVNSLATCLRHGDVVQEVTFFDVSIRMLVVFITLVGLISFSMSLRY